MSQLKKEVKLSLKVMLNKEKTKVLFAEANGDFVDVLLSFLTLPLGKVVKVLKKHYGDKAPVIGSLSTLYKGLANLDSVHFWTEAGKQMLLNPRSSFETECFRLKLDITDTQPPEGLGCPICTNTIVSLYDAATCIYCGVSMKKQRVKNESEAGGGVFAKNTATYIISDDLHILPDVSELVQIISHLGITDTRGMEIMNVTFGFTEIMDLFKASLFSPTPLSDIILARKTHVNLATMKPEPGSISSFQTKTNAASSGKKVILKVIVQKSTNKLLYARGGEDFIYFLSSFLTIPLGGIVSLLGSNNSSKSINNLYRSTADLIDTKFFVSPEIKDRLIKMKLPHGSISKNQILPLTEEQLSTCNRYSANFSSVNFPQGQGNYVKGLRTYTVADDLTVTLFCVSSIISKLNGLNIAMSDIEEVELQIGLQEALRILKASLTSTCVLTDALTVNLVAKKQPKQEMRSPIPKDVPSPIPTQSISDTYLFMISAFNLQANYYFISG